MLLNDWMHFYGFFLICSSLCPTYTPSYHHFSYCCELELQSVIKLIRWSASIFKVGTSGSLSVAEMNLAFNTSPDVSLLQGENTLKWADV
ncbi:hypothetical protein MRB53_027303 [Persea americana]|uniref:Uncharacterized protein n=1 Tax=Persea americana TaxID=3435 RepID=A0ACC2LKM6_PERAE|nr:hypothetical protein MRB53_027303 [Persea americana]